MAIYQAPDPNRDVARQARSFGPGINGGTDIDLAAQSGVVTHAASFLRVHNEGASEEDIVLEGEDGVQWTETLAADESIPVPCAVRKIIATGTGADITVTAYWLLGASPKNP